MKEIITLGKSEWIVMEKFWDIEPWTYVNLCHAMNEEMGWSRSTVQTMLSRMVDKGVLRYEVVGRTKHYYPLVSKDEVALTETKSFLEKVFSGSASLMMSTLVKNKQLSKKEIEELYAILENAEGENHE